MHTQSLQQEVPMIARTQLITVQAEGLLYALMHFWTVFHNADTHFTPWVRLQLAISSIVVLVMVMVISRRSWRSSNPSIIRSPASPGYDHDHGHSHIPEKLEIFKSIN